jgi:alpha-tubulin suppressor-like RCC1 family protein
MKTWKQRIRRTPLWGLLLCGGCVVVYDGSITAPDDVFAPSPPVLERTEPASPSRSVTPRVFGNAEVGARVWIFAGAACEGDAIAQGTAEEFASVGIEVAIARNATTLLAAIAVDAAGNASPCSPTSIPFTQDDLAPTFAGVLTTTAVSPTQIAVSWSPATDGTTAERDLRYELCVAPSAAPNACEPFVATHDAGQGRTFWNVGGLAEDTEYTFVLRATDRAGNTALHESRVRARTNDARTASLAAGAYHTCALDAAGKPRCWGWNGLGQLGVVGLERSSIAVDVPGVEGARAIVAGGMHTCVLNADRTVSCWGDKSGPDGVAPATPVRRIEGLTNVVALSSALAHTCALDAAGTVRCFGDNSQGQLGDGTLKNSARPVVADVARGAVAIAAGDHFTCALNADGGVTCFGGNLAGEIGDATSTSERPASARIPGIERAIGIAAGWGHACALLHDGSVRCWGVGDEGQLGDGERRDRAQASTVADLTLGRRLTAGWNHACAIRADGSAMCWGRNADGQLGDGTTEDRSRAGAVKELSQVIAMSAGESHTCALAKTGEIRCFGRNDFGQLGDGTLRDRTIPTATAR